MVALSLGWWLPLAAPARAADVTEMAPALGVRSFFRYGGSTLRGDLVEEGGVVASRQVDRHDLDLAAEFAPVAGFAATLQLALTPAQTWSYTDTRAMVVEPADGTGSYLSGEPTKDVSLDTRGFGGVWLGAALAPFSESYAKNQHATWRLDVGFRTPSSGRNLWVARDGARGPAPGGSAFRLAGAFSTDRGVGSPFVTASWVHENRAELTIVDEEGTTWARKLAVKPADVVDLRAGISLRAHENADAGSAFDVELWMGAQYRAWEDVASGLYLPNVLASGRSIPVTAGDSIAGVAGLGLETALNEHVEVRTGAEFTYRTPYRLEHVYDVKTSADTWQLGWFFALQGQGSFRAPAAPTDDEP